MRQRPVLLSFFCGIALIASPIFREQAWSAEYPTKPIEMVVPFAPGGAADIAARILASGAEKTLGKPIAVINRTGGGGAIGYSSVKNARPDGYTLMWNSTALLTLAHAGNIDFDYRGFEAVCLISTETPTLAVKKDAAWKDLRELIDYAKKNPGKVRVGNSGFGSATHIAAEALEEIATAPMTHVPLGRGSRFLLFWAARSRRACSSLLRSPDCSKLGRCDCLE